MSGSGDAGASGSEEAGASEFGGATATGGGPTATGGAGATVTGGGPTATGGGGTTTTGGGGAGGNGSASCNTLVQGGSAVAIESNPEVALPAGTQGTIASGKYFLTKAEWFIDSFGANLTGTISVANQGTLTTIQGVLSVGEIGTVRYTSTLVTNTPVTSIYTCEDPPGALGLLPALNIAAPSDYTATASTLSLSFPSDQPGHGYRLTYTKQ